MKTLQTSVVVAIILACYACSASTKSLEPQTDQGAQPNRGAASQYPDSKLFYDFFVKEETLSYNGYQITKSSKKVRIEGVDRGVQVTYASLRNKSHVLATFDGLYHSVGNATDFGLASLLGGDSKQLVVSQTVPRGGRHWVADLQSDGAVLFDSGDYGLGREEAFVMDVDKDGISEIGLVLTAFWGFGPVAMADHRVMPMIVFKYDPQLRRYLPANPFFAYGLEHLEEDASDVDSAETPGDALNSEYLGKRLAILLHYIYAGKRDEGWAFFDKTYRLSDSRKMKSQIQKRLQSEPVYKFIYGKNAN